MTGAPVPGAPAMPTLEADAALGAYRGLLARYHRTLDLLSPAGYADIERHLAEAERYAAALLELSRGCGPVVDLGSGAGLPGVVVAVRLAPLEVWWVERRRRRAAFLTQVAAHAGLASVRVLEGDVRGLARPAGGIGAVTAQAVGTLAQVAALTLPLWGSRVLLVTRKGPDWPSEVDELAVWLRRAERAARGAWAEPRVLRSEALGTRGTLVAVEVLGG